MKFNWYFYLAFDYLKFNEFQPIRDLFGSAERKRCELKYSIHATEKYLITGGDNFMFAKISVIFLLGLCSALGAETINCKKTENAEPVFSMNTENLKGQVSSGSRSLSMNCHVEGEKAYRCFAQSELDGLHSFEVIISKSPRFIEYYGRNFWAYDLSCEISHPSDS